jgi:uncharacterized ion transporter superfamily protein YfcC
VGSRGRELSQPAVVAPLTQPDRVTFRVPHPLTLLLAGVAIAAALTWMLPAGEFSRRDDEATGRRVVVPGTYRTVEPSPVGPFATIVSVPRGFVEAAEVIAAVLFVGGAWVVVDTLGILARLVGALATRFQHQGLLAIPFVSLFFAVMGALENMQEEIIPLVPVLLVLGRRLGIDAISVVAMSAGAAMIGSAFGPANPFQAGIAMKLAELPPFSGGAVRLAMLVAGTAGWIVWTVIYARRTRVPPEDSGEVRERASRADVAIFVTMLLPIAAYVYGALALDWGFNELTAGFLISGLIAGLAGGMSLDQTIDAYFEGMKALLPAAVMIGVARSISVVLADGHVIDTILNGLSQPLSHATPMAAAFMMIPFHAIIHVAVSSVSGQAVLTMPVLVPLSDLLGISRQVTVVAYQTGAGLCELLTPTNGALMAVLLAAGVPFGKWFRFAAVGTLVGLLIGIVGMLVI